MPDPDALLATLLAAVPTLPGIDSVHLFGSMAHDTHDALSDIDLQIFVHDVDAAWAARASLVAGIAPVLVELPLVADDDARAATVLFRDLPPTLKLDMGFQPIPARKAWIRQHPERCLWRSGEGMTDISPVSHPGAEPIPTPNDPVTRAILDQVLGAVRYVKARRRGQVVVAWRFAIALAESALAVTASEITGQPYTGRKLTTPEYVTLERQLANGAKEALHASLFFADLATLDARVSGWVDVLDRYQRQAGDDNPAVRAALTSVAEWVRHECSTGSTYGSSSQETCFERAAGEFDTTSVHESHGRADAIPLTARAGSGRAL